VGVETRMRAAYDAIGRDYGAQRRPDPRIAAAIRAALGDAARVVNVGAGTGSYEPADLGVVAVEPSRVMIGQRRAGAAPAVQGAAEALPFADGAFDAALAVLTLHHWRDRGTGLAELVRVARRRVVIVTWDPACTGDFWLTRDYLRAVVDLDAAIFPTLAELDRALGGVRVAPLPIPHDCADGFLGAFWSRPEAYLDPAVRSAMSTLAWLAPAVVASGVARLADDLATGRWESRYGHLRAEREADLGYRLVVAERPGGRGPRR
jgi:SAM-dependent methyltransferase